ncbi:Hypothetical predicted protein [Mytilus galloprovincialis]|uniref:Uncharacterized protein n=1 Tax=Mytilus galloprovincialis TaxID=29158 RepID=A0A8B6G2C1_MYTGA|nr:Hypothetical predicted protein [Mytilus galloprovincialis]
MRTINKQKNAHKKEQKCGEVYCKTCKDYIEPEHLCFMMPLQDDKKISPIAVDDTKWKRNTQDADPNPKVYIFFDFECTQDDLVQCEQGYERSDDSLKSQGYNPEEKHSIKALKWLRYVSKSKGIHIQHARNGGEKNIDAYRVDGYHKSEDGEEIVFEYHGCF